MSIQQPVSSNQFTVAFLDASGTDISEEVSQLSACVTSVSDINYDDRSGSARGETSITVLNTVAALKGIDKLGRLQGFSIMVMMHNDAGDVVAQRNLLGCEIGHISFSKMETTPKKSHTGTSLTTKMKILFRSFTTAYPEPKEEQDEHEEAGHGS